MSERPPPLLTIGTLSARTGVSITAIRFYERKGLIASVRTGSGHRRFHRSTIRRLSIIVVCQRLGYPLSEIADRLAALPTDRTADDADWAALAREFRAEIDDRVERLLSLRDQLDGCIGCGCISLDVCMLYNPDDAAAELGPGPRYLLGQSSADLPESRAEEGPIAMEPTQWHLAQINIGRLRHPVDDPRVAEFMDNLDAMNELAERSAGYVWRLQDESGNATGIRAFDDETILPNLTVWESIEDLKAYVYKSDHARFLRRRREWFLPMDDLPVLTMWWIPAGHLPTLDEARARIDHLLEHGPTPHAFSFRPTFDPPGDSELDTAVAEPAR
ncbi:MAG: redox-sensitive transcriptional activator SoxR [Actinomycetota bacterium]